MTRTYPVNFAAITGNTEEAANMEFRADLLLALRANHEGPVLASQVWRFGRRSRLTHLLPLEVDALTRLCSASTLPFIFLYRLAAVLN